MSAAGYDHRESSDIRESKAKLRLQEKVALLEKWSIEGVPEGYESCPSKIGEFNDWQDEDLSEVVVIDGGEHTLKGVYRLSTPTTNKYKDTLKADAIKYMRKIADAPKPKGEVKRLTAEVAILTDTRTKLGNEIVELRYEINELYDELSDARRKQYSLEARNKELRKLYDDLKTQTGKVTHLKSSK